MKTFSTNLCRRITFLWAPRLQTAFFNVGEALNRTVLPALTLIDSPVRG